MTLTHQPRADLDAEQYHENSPSALLSQTLVQTRRILLRWARDLTTVIEALVLPVLFLLTLNIILGNVISQVTGHSALYGTVPLNALAATINGAAVGAIGLIGERSDGLLRRLWVVPVHRASGVLSRIAAEVVRIMLTTLVVLAVGMVLGFRFRQGIPATLLWFLVPLVFGLAFATLITMVALYTANNFLLETVTLVHVLAVVFSTGFLPVDQFPRWIRPVVAHQPMSDAIEAMRGLSMGGPVRAPMIATLVWAAGIAAVCSVPAFIGYRRASTS
ncbi:ABC transporter permease [Mycobacterium sherrisii]|uniref:Transport permease protein n=1 Tax=Mycobacterium sherrisii TaxID=243061 RepID=A0A1E3T7I9_9MYCO|nr:ABC transporter permease [Mycobacterium sherrisii]MCV7028976.1 ABC transporter permease [Mycobacterium sherrisii]MEC4765410.1 ABC transporter permease [Mycobacterium sherrisii]ODR10439.1 peptide ABC transporter permease [Mycobacterium sherrisii]ORW75762.1 peptide ABC transporter permease [Mycobacterium sherrisii]